MVDEQAQACVEELVHWVPRSSKLVILMMICLQLVYSGVESTDIKPTVTDAANATPGITVLGAKGLCDALHNISSTALSPTDQRSGIELLGLKDCVEEHDAYLR